MSVLPEKRDDTPSLFPPVMPHLPLLPLTQRVHRFPSLYTDRHSLIIMTIIRTANVCRSHSLLPKLCSLPPTATTARRVFFNLFLAFLTLCRDEPTSRTRDGFPVAGEEEEESLPLFLVNLFVVVSFLTPCSVIESSPRVTGLGVGFVFSVASLICM